jgi:predicted 3-demethylubiquinone-9 3-methyltransferase (glyoxalase superfamily)
MATLAGNQFKITPCLWFDGNAGEAADFYTSVFKNSSILATSYYGKNSPMPEGTVLTVKFKIEGQNFLALNGGPYFKFNESVSFMISCENQEEIDYFWNKLTEGGAESQCGWLKDKFGLSWQVVPVQLEKLMTDKTPGKSGRVMAELMKMKKIDLRILEEA